MPGPNPTIRFGVEMSPESKQQLSGIFNDIKQRFKELRETRGADDPEVKRYKEILDAIRKTTDAQQKGSEQARTYARDLSGVANTIRSAISGLSGGAGAGMAGSVLSTGVGALAGGLGVAAVIGTVATVVGMAMRMAYEFERTTTRAALSLSIGTNNFAGGMAAIRAGSYAGEPYGISTVDMSAAIAAYGATSGVTAARAGGAGRDIARYARGYGLDPNVVAQMVGGFTGTTNETFGQSASALFGGAEGSGNLGRRIGEFVGVATGVLTQLQMSNPSRNYTTETAASLVQNIARLGGVFSSAQGVQSTFGGLSSLMSGTSSDIARMANAQRAGITNPIDLILERNSPQNMRKLLEYGLKAGSPNTNSSGYAAYLASIMGPQQANMVFEAINRAGGGKRGIDALTNPSSAGAAPIDQRVGNYLGTTLSQYERLFAKTANTMTADGDKAIRALGGAAEFATDQLDRLGTQIGRFMGGGDFAAVSGKVSGIGNGYDSAIAYDLGHAYNPRTRRGITVPMSQVLQTLGSRYSVGLSAVTEGTHAKHSLHYLGEAADVAMINGRAVGSNFNLDRQFAESALASDPRVRVGTYKRLYEWLSKRYGDRVFRDEGSGPHEHVDVGYDYARGQFGDLAFWSGHGAGATEATINNADGSTTRVTHSPPRNHAAPKGPMHSPRTRRQ